MSGKPRHDIQGGGGKLNSNLYARVKVKISYELIPKI